MPIPFRILDDFTDDGFQLLADFFVVLKEAWRESVSDCGVDLLAEDREEVVVVVVDYVFDYHRLYLGAGWHAKGCDLVLN